MTTKTKTRSSYDVFKAITNRMETIDVSYRARGDVLVLADLREGKACVVAKPFKWDGQELGRGEQFTCNLMNIPRIAHLMENNGRVLISQSEATDRAEWARLKPVKEHLSPLVLAARNHKTEAQQAKGAKEAAEQSARYWAGQQEAAEANNASVEREMQEYISSLNGTLKEI